MWQRFRILSPTQVAVVSIIPFFLSYTVHQKKPWLDWRKIAISLKTPAPGEEMAQACAIA